MKPRLPVIPQQKEPPRQRLYAHLFVTSFTIRPRRCTHGNRDFIQSNPRYLAAANVNSHATSRLVRAPRHRLVQPTMATLSAALLQGMEKNVPRSKRKLQKHLRSAGLAYISRTGKLIPAKKVAGTYNDVLLFTTSACVIWQFENYIVPLRHCFESWLYLVCFYAYFFREVLRPCTRKTLGPQCVTRWISVAGGFVNFVASHGKRQNLGHSIFIGENIGLVGRYTCSPKTLRHYGKF